MTFELKEKEELKEKLKGKIVLLNGIPVSELAERDITIIKLERLTPDEFKKEIEKRLGEGAQLESYIRHPATVEVLNKLINREIPVSAGIYKLDPRDTIYIVTLKTVPERGKEIKVTSPEELVYLKMSIL